MVGGASHGIGFAIASMLASEGVNVVAFARRASHLRKPPIIFARPAAWWPKRSPIFGARRT